jgi:predicted nucleic acid-binding protein
LSGLVFDSSPLSHFARADELETLAEITASHERFVTQAVLDELSRGVADHPLLADVSRLPWLVRVRSDSLAELAVFAEYARVLGSGARDVGEASTLARAEIDGQIAIVDERAGTRLGRERGLEVHGTLWLIAEGYSAGLLGDAQAEDLVDALSDAEAWFPCRGSEFLDWARSEGLLRAPGERG